MTLGLAPRQGDLLRTTAIYCQGRVSSESIYAVLHRECFKLFPDELFVDVFTDVGRRSVPPVIVAVVMVLQRAEGLSDREAVERFAFDARWKYAAGGLDFDYPGFGHTVLVDMRARLARSDRPDRIFEVTLEAARKAGLVGRKCVLDSTPLYDAVATMDTVTLIRSAIRGLFQAAAGLESELRAVLTSGDDYASAAKPQIDWEDPAEREAVVDSRATDAFALLALLDDRELGEELTKAAQLVATVVGQDLAEGEDGVFRIARKVATGRVISTVDPEARHGHKTSHRGFDGYKGHIAVDPDSELITTTAATAGNSGDAEIAEHLLADVLTRDEPESVDAPEDGDGDRHTEADPVEVYGDSAYGTGELLTRLENADAHIGIKVQPAVAPGGRFTKDHFIIDPTAATATCPAGVSVAFRQTGHQRHAAVAEFGAACTTCPLAAQCTTATNGRTITIGAHEAQLAAARARQKDPAWQAAYTATRPKVERKIGHLMRRRHGGRRARVRGLGKVAADFALLAASVNLARLGVLGLTSRSGGGWQITLA